MNIEDSEILPDMLSASELKRRHALLKLYDEGDPWQADGERLILPLRDSLAKYAEHFDGLPESFIPMAMDQYLAALWHTDFEQPERERYRLARAGDREYQRAYELFNEEPWLYAAFIVLEDEGAGRYLCMDDEQGMFMLYSPSLANALKEGSRVFLSLVLHIGDDWYMTHGPILGWRGFSLGDIVSFASRLDRRLYVHDGLDAVVRADPVPFWALWKYGKVPALGDGTEPTVYCTLRGTLGPDFEENLPRTWRREDAGKKTRWVYGSGKPETKRRYVYLDRTKGKAHLAAYELGEFEKLIAFVRTRFIPSGDPPEALGALMAAIQKDLLGADSPLAELEKPFRKSDAPAPDEGVAENPAGRAKDGTTEEFGARGSRMIGGNALT